MNPENALKILKEGTLLLDGIKWWVSAGTALGAYRDGLSDAFLEKDTDIDVEVEGYPDLEERYLSNGFKIHARICGDEFKTQLALMKDGIIFDIYFYEKGCGNHVNINPFGAMLIPSFLIENASIITVRGIDLVIPSPPEDYLLVRYGPNWRIPSDKINWWEQANNMVHP